MTHSTTKNPDCILTLRDIAAWHIPGIEKTSSNIVAAPPSLQRGAIWEPQQIEMLWDSIMRGFPIGSLVLARKIENQLDKPSPMLVKDGDTIIKTGASHHILDGQQRCNAIAWGFADPWITGLSDNVILWLDLMPDNRLRNSTRKYLFRVTTKAHPWGFNYSDQSGNLSANRIRKHLEQLTTLYTSGKYPDKFSDKITTYIKADHNKTATRPLTKLSLPSDAGFPVPMFLLFKHFNQGKLNLDTLAQDEWLKVIEAWTNLSVGKINNIDLEHIESGLAMAEQARIVALQVPELISSIDDIELIFQRLNGQGTPLDKEELAYSLIKAYWPDVDKVMCDLPPHTTEARLVGMGARVALAGQGSDKLIAELSVDRIRGIFRTGNGTVKEGTESKSIAEFESITEFFSGGSFKNALHWIDGRFLYDESERSYGLPAYLRSSVAWHSPDVFAWLILLAKRHGYKPIDHGLAKKIIGLALTVHWFGKDKAMAVNTLVREHDNLATLSISDLNMDANRPSVLVPLSREELEDAFQLGENSTSAQLVGWKGFWEGVVNRNVQGERYSEVEAESRKKYGFFVDEIRSRTELLVYAQRKYINTFEFDPSNKLMWKGHNRPWDYDHILPSNTLDRRGHDGATTYHEICKTWQQSVGNLLAVDFSFNRSAQDTVDACQKYADKNYFNLYLENPKAFCLTVSDTDNEDKARLFALSAKNRLIIIYQEWYCQLEIDRYRVSCSLG